MARAVPRTLSRDARHEPDLAIRAAAAAWVAARAAVALGFLAAHGAVDALRPGDPPLPLVQGLAAWDGAFYRDIATVGYGALPEEALRFFPLFPLLGRVLGAVVPGGATTALVLVANAAALVAGVLLHRLVVHEGGTARTATTAVWLLALVPAGAVLALAYTEALFLALAVGAFLALRQERWWHAAALGVLAGLCRPSGALLALAAGVQAVAMLRRGSWRARAGPLAAVVAPVAGTGLYLAWVGLRFGDPLLPLRVQGGEDLRGGWVLPVTRVVDAVLDAPAEGLLGESLHLPWIALSVALAVVVGRRLPAAYTAYTVAVLVLALSGSSLGSFERYALTAFPLTMVAASLVPPPLERLVLTVLAAGVAGFTCLVLLAVFVP